MHVRRGGPGDRGPRQAPAIRESSAALGSQDFTFLTGFTGMIPKQYWSPDWRCLGPRVHAVDVGRRVHPRPGEKGGYDINGMHQPGVHRTPSDPPIALSAERV